MLNFITRATRHVLPARAVVTNLQKRLQLFASFTARDIIYETSDDAGTLLTRFAKHLAVESYKFDPLIPTKIRYADYFPVQDVRSFRREAEKISANQLPALIIFAFTYRSNGDPGKFADVLNDIDSICTRRLPDMDNDTLLRTLYSFLFLIPNKITQTDFYKKAMMRLVQDFSEVCSKEKFVQACFYIGLSKKNPHLHQTADLLKDFVSQNLPTYVQQLSSMDMAIVASATYKTATVVNCETYLKRLEEETIKASADDSLLVTFIKCLRMQRVKSENICKHLSSLCNDKDLKQLQLTGLSHVFAYFAENRWDELKCTKQLVVEFMQRIKKLDRSLEKVRPKDICMFLWCCSQLQCQLSEEELKYLERLVLNKVDNNEFKYIADQLVDCVLSLWTIGMKSRDLLHEALNLKGISKSNPKLREHSKVDTRFTMLQSIEAIEFPARLPAEDKKSFGEKSIAPAYLLKGRPDLVSYAQQLKDEEDVASAPLVCPIRGFNIPSILVEYKKETPKVFIELLTDEQLLRFSQEPVGIIKLKINLLTAKGYRVICLRPNDLSDNYVCLKDIAFKEENCNRALAVNSI